jgi:ketosteroid isomerase-like protein
MLRVWLAVGIGVAALAVSGLVTSMARAQAGDPSAVIVAYEMARNRRDLDAALTYFADDATISQRNTTFSGKEEIRKFLEGVAARSRFIVVSDRHAVGNRVTWTERSSTQAPGPQGPPAVTQGQAQAQAQGFTGVANAGTPNVTPGGQNAASQVNVEAVVQDGKIRSMAFLMPNQPTRLDPSLEGRAQLPAAIGLGGVLILMFGVLAVASMSLRRGGAGASTLRGRLMHDLRGWSAARQ